MASHENDLTKNDAATGQDPLVGSLLDGRYLIEREIGSGGMSAVYIARDLKVHGRNVVVKVLLQESFQHEYVVKKFRQEAEALSRVDHPHVIRILDFGEMAGGSPYLVLQYIEGENLRVHMAHGLLDLGRTAQIVRQVGSALTAAHAKGIMHRDLKPENVMLQPLAGGEEQVIVIDFGIARVDDSVIAPKTMVAAAAGTIAYMSPEQLCAGDLTPASDTYALAVMTYEVVTGRKPFEPKSPFQLLEMQRAGVQTCPRELRPELPEAAEEILMRALSFDAAARPAHTRDFGGEFCRLIAGAPGSTTTCVDPPGTSAATPTGFVNPRADASSILVGGDALKPGEANANTPRANSAGAATDMLPEPAVKTLVETAQLTSAAPALQSLQQTSVIDPVAQPASEPSATETRSKSLPIAAGVLLLCGVLGAAGFGVWKFTRQDSTAPARADAVPRQPAPAATSVPDSPPPSAATQIDLNYSLTVQRMRDGKAFREPFQSTGREIFEEGWQFRLNVSKTKPGYLYLLNEGLNAGGAVAYTVLFPVAGDAALAANETVQIPKAPEFYFFTGTAGTEKIWMVWAEQPIAEMEAIKSAVNPKDQGEITDPSQIESVRGFLAKHASSNQEVVRDAAKKETIVKAQGDILVHLAELEHQ